MKSSTPAGRALLHGAQSAAFADLVTITLSTGTILRWTTGPLPIRAGGQDYSPGGVGGVPIIKRGRIRETRGTEASTLDLVLSCGSESTIGGVGVQLFAVNGGLDSAEVLVQRAYTATPGGALVATVHRFSGTVASAEVTSFGVTLQMQSDAYRLNEVLPRYCIREKCVWDLYGPGCGLSKTAHTHASTVNSGGYDAYINGLYVNLSGATYAFGYFSGGMATFTSGALAGITRNIVQHASQYANSYCLLTLDRSLPAAPAVGDGVSVVEGCDKLESTCRTKFSHQTYRRGFDFVPPPDMVTR